ncbi:PREDICTED: uncharacterized protein LOC108362877 [Rhagoletis zephyria]|uniref:uncharacterized protein LOC108362877 n=1 Tax=Rhagoletis zephyria TaxID=28612 RepID=UPI0008113834|nr:PREDICTED: uncharacterized protein LOC108362877 [Rhagoletis zephyria]
MDFDDTFDLIIIILLLNEARKCLDVILSSRTSHDQEVYTRPKRIVNFTRNVKSAERDVERDIAVFNQYFDKICNKDEEVFNDMVNMSKEVFDLLFNLVKQDLTKHSNRPSITPKCRLFVTLVYLANGGSRRMLASAFELGLSTVQKIVIETCQVVWSSLSLTYLPIEQAPDWIALSQQFESKWNLPNCLGAIDIKTIILKCPNKDIPNLYDKKGKYSIAMLGACDANYTFTGVDVAVFGYKEDNVVWNTGFAEKLFAGRLNLPEDNILPNSNIEFPYYFVGDTLSPLKNHIMRIYPGKSLSQCREAFNSRLERARQVIENSLGLLGARWKILTNPLTLSPQNMIHVFKATVLLHNFARTHDNSYCPLGYVDRYEGDNVIPGGWRDEITPLQKSRKLCSNNATQQAFKLRDILCEYLEKNPVA